MKIQITTVRTTVTLETPADVETLAAAKETPAAATETPCVICGAHAFGQHYGIICCDACGTFFFRTTSRKKVYKCVKKTGNCLITAKSRKCGACRMRKCIEKGMKKKLKKIKAYSLKASNN